MQKVYQLIGMAYRAGQVVSGAEAVEQSLKRGKCRLVIISEDIAANSRKQILGVCERRQVSWISVGDRYALGASMGKEYRVAVGINDSGFAGAIERAQRETQ